MNPPFHLSICFMEKTSTEKHNEKTGAIIKDLVAFSFTG